MDYWNECVSIAFDEEGIKATDEQINNVAGAIEGAHENYGMYSGNDVASANFISDEARELEELKKSIEKRRIWEVSTKPCRACTTNGQVKDGWGRDIGCDSCGGEGRVRH